MIRRLLARLRDRIAAHLIGLVADPSITGTCCDHTGLDEHADEALHIAGGSSELGRHVTETWRRHEAARGNR